MSRLTAEKINSLNLGIASTDSRGILYTEGALSWVEKHTTYTVDYDNLDQLPAEVLLFVAEYCDLLRHDRNVASESIEGLSQSFVTGVALETQIYELAYAVLGRDAIRSTVTVLSGEERWDYGS